MDPRTFSALIVAHPDPSTGMEYDANREVSCICVGHKGEYVRDPDCTVCNAEEAEPEPAESPACPACGGETKHLGSLGRRDHFRCIGCGMDCSSRVA